MTKDKVLAVLKNNNDYVSGESISGELGLSRMAISTAVKSLRQDGYEIESVTKKGYKLLKAPDKLTIGELLAYVDKNRIERVKCLDSTESTNKLLQSMAMEGAKDGQVVIANEQTKGRGRLGRTFNSPKDGGIYFSYLMKPQNRSPQDATCLTAWTAVAISDAIEEVCGITPGIKWVNDLVLNKKKICGILTEMSIESESGMISSIIIGIGVNVNELTTDFPEEIQNIASSIRIETGKVFSRSRIAAAMIKHMDILNQNWPDSKDKYLEKYIQKSVTVGQDVSVSFSGEDVPRHAYAETINSDYTLQVKYEDGTTEAVSSGDVSVRGLYGYC
ncbi:MAG: biotin--[acetyl-CoA-carboxylase] ligase [Butyrivibrio sp.]|nr:biotin--[acetyl-CoA-carboxylase] ligase [Butyrivibrio sp.]